MAEKDINLEVKKMSLDSSTRVTDYLPYNMIEDRRTEMYVKAAKIIVLYQGPLTSKRKDVTKELAEKFRNASRIISDDTYCKECCTSFNAENTIEFHNYFKREVKKACEEGSNLIVIDASLTHLQQLEFYLFLAQKFQYVTLIVPPLVKVDVTSPVQFQKVKASQAQSLLQSGARMSSIGAANNFEHYFCAWFLHEADSYSLRCEASLYIKDLFENIDRFAARYSRVCTVENFSTYFNLDDRRQDLAYCVVTIFESLKKMSDYFSQQCVKNLYGKMTKLTIVGFIISPYTVAARVRLSYKQRELWTMPDDIDENSKRQPAFFPSEMVENAKILLKEDIKLISCKANPTQVNSGDPLLEPLKSVDLRLKGRSAHIVLGKAPNAPINCINYDVQYAIFREKRLRATNPDAIETTDIGRSIVFSIGKFWYVYLKEHIEICGFLATCCKPKSFR